MKFGPAIRRETEVIVRVRKGRNRELWIGQITARTGPEIRLRPWGWNTENDGFVIRESETERISVVASLDVPADKRREVATVQAERRPYRVDVIKGHAVEVGGALLSTAEAAARVGITPDAMVRRIKAHGLDSEAVLAPRRPTRRGIKPSPFEGRSVAAAARAAGLSVQCVHKRLARGMDPEAALSPLRRPGLPRVTYAGADWLLADLARHAGMPISTLRSRLAAGADLETAVSAPVQPRRKRETGTHKL